MVAAVAGVAAVRRSWGWAGAGGGATRWVDTARGRARRAGSGVAQKRGGRTATRGRVSKPSACPNLAQSSPTKDRVVSPHRTRLAEASQVNRFSCPTFCVRLGPPSRDGRAIVSWHGCAASQQDAGAAASSASRAAGFHAAMRRGAAEAVQPAANNIFSGWEPRAPDAVGCGDRRSDGRRKAWRCGCG